MNARMREDEVRALAISYGAAANEVLFAADGAEAQSVAQRFGRPVAVKLIADNVIHKSKAGGVLLNVPVDQVADRTDAMLAAQRLKGAEVRGVTVESMVEPGIEVVVGGLRTPNFGPVIMFGQGGVDIETLDDVAFALAPLDRAAAEKLVRNTRIGRALDNRMPDRFADLVELLDSVGGETGMLMSEAVTEVDLNPIVVNPDRIVAVDARARTLDEIPAPVAVPDPAAAYAALRPAIYPESVAVVGASADTAKMGYRVVRDMVEFGFKGELYPVSRTASEIHGIPAVASVDQLPEGVDRAVLTIPAKAVPQALADLAARGVKTAHVYTADTPEFDPSLADRGLRILGPNCMGHYAPSVGITMIAPRASGIESGGIAIISQSGTYAGDAVRRGKELGLRFSFVSSVGNCDDVSPAELLAFCEADDRTTAVAFYVEDDRGAAEFFRLAASITKPVVLLKGGRTAAGGAAAASHTGALASDPQLMEDIARQAGVLMVDDLDHMLDVLTMLQIAPTIEGDGLALVGSGGGVAVVGADKADAWDLTVPTLSDAVQAGLQQFAAPGTSLSNPIDVPIWSMFAGDTSFTGELLEAALSDEQVHVACAFLDLGTVFDMLEGESADEVVDLLTRGLLEADRFHKPLAIVLRSSFEEHQDELVRRYRRIAADSGAAVFDSVDRAITAIGGVRQLTRALQR